MRVFQSRRAITFIELMIVIAIVALLLALLLAAVMRVRETAAVAQSKNNLRQIILATHHYADAHGGQLPKLGAGRTRIIGNSAYAGKMGSPLLVQILPYVEAQIKPGKGKVRFHTVALFLSPADPGAAEAIAKNAAVSSYAANAVVFLDDPRFPGTFGDGTSNTIAFAEHYALNCNNISFPYWQSTNVDHLKHRASFADTCDVLPVTEGNPPVSMPSIRPGAFQEPTFQVAPRPGDCTMWLPQTPHSSGMVVALADGSVRQLAPGISPSLFWGAVTPNKGEILGDW